VFNLSYYPISNDIFAIGRNINNNLDITDPLPDWQFLTDLEEMFVTEEKLF